MAISVNRVTLVGRLGADPEERGGGSGPVALRVATSESWKDKNTGEKREKTEWHSVVVWPEPTKKFLMQYAVKGDLVYVEGQLSTSEYEKNGEKRYSTSVEVKPFSGSIQLMSRESHSDSGSRDGGGSSDRGSRSSGSTRPGTGRPGQNRPAFEPDDDIPFAPQVD